MENKYFVQCKHPDGAVSLDVLTDMDIVEKVGFRDCTDCEYEVFSGSVFGRAVKLEYVPATEAPFNYHKFINPETGTVVISGYSTEH